MDNRRRKQMKFFLCSFSPLFSFLVVFSLHLSPPVNGVKIQREISFNCGCLNNSTDYITAVEKALKTIEKQSWDIPRPEGLPNIHKPTGRNYLPLPTGHVFSLQDITMATRNFADDEFVIMKTKSYQLYIAFTSSSGSGMVVIKRIMNSSSRRVKLDFQVQVSLLNTLPLHPNVLGLLGYCDEGNELILVYVDTSTLQAGI